MRHIKKFWLMAVCLLSLATVAAGQAVEGKWAGWLESPGSTAAIRLEITREMLGAFSDGAGRVPGDAERVGDVRGASKVTMNIFGEETVHPLSELTLKDGEISFTTELFIEKFAFKGKLQGKELVAVVATIP